MRETLQRARSCVSNGVPVAENDGLIIRLRLRTNVSRGTAGFVTFDARHLCALLSDAARPARERWQARTAGYFYSLDAAGGREIVAYHWHPTGRSHVTAPHLHLGAGAGTLAPELSKAHPLTGRVTPVAVLRLLIERFAVAPRRADWDAVLNQADGDLTDG